MARLTPRRAASETETTRLFLLLLIGALLAAAVTIAAQGLNHHSRRSQSHAFTTAERIVDLAGTGADPVAALMNGLPGAAGQKLGSPDPALTRTVADAFRRRGVEGVTVQAYHAPAGACGGATRRLACRILVLGPHAGAARPVAISLPPAPRPWSLSREAAALLAAGLAGVLLAGWLASRMAAGPLNRLSQGAVALSHDLDRPPLVEEGGREVRQAAAALNVMQTRLQALIEDRTRVLAAVAHDLQTPLTRMRLRIEKVEDAALRAQLVNDLGAMQHLVREGLDLARIETTTEAVIPVDLDALLEALCEDAADAGQPVAFIGGCGAVIHTRPQALRRCVTNLMDNAVRHGGDAQLAAARIGADIRLTVRDHGPGAPEDQIARLFEPFYRLDPSRSRDSGGSGLGLTIARRMAERAGAGLTLANAQGGGMIATLTFPAA